MACAVITWNLPKLLNNCHGENLIEVCRSHFSGPSVWDVDSPERASEPHKISLQCGGVCKNAFLNLSESGVDSCA